MIEYQRYIGKVFKNKDGTYFGKVINIRDTITFEANTIGGILRAFKNSVEGYIEFCKSRGEEPEEAGEIINVKL
jgi:predicted HicB family RNase H-like nuclease